MLLFIYQFIRICTALSRSTPASVITSDFNETYPFYYWPENVTIPYHGDSTLDLLCIVDNCNNGPFLVIGGHNFGPDDCLVESQCKRQLRKPNSLVNEDNGVWFLRIKTTLNKIWNCSSSVISAGNEPIPVWCRTTDANSTVSYINIESNYVIATTVASSKPMASDSEGASKLSSSTTASKVSQSLASINVLTLSVLTASFTYFRIG